MIDRAQTRSNGRDFGPLSPPTMIQSKAQGAADGRVLGMNGDTSIGPSNGSALMNRTAAGVCNSSGMRVSAKCWFSTLTPSQTFDRGQPDPSRAVCRSANVGTSACIRSGRLVRI